jgi:hypothetical protein
MCFLLGAKISIEQVKIAWKLRRWRAISTAVPHARDGKRGGQFPSSKSGWRTAMRYGTPIWMKWLKTMACELEKVAI